MKKGFTLIELMIVVAIIAIIAAIAIPNLIENRMQANETNAVAALKQYGNAQATFKKANYGGVAANIANAVPTVAKQYSSSFALLGGPNAYVNGAGNKIELIPPVFAAATNANAGYQGYYFTDSTAVTNWLYDYGLYADPCVYAKTGLNAYMIDGKGTAYMKDLGGVASAGAGKDATWVVP